MQGHIMTANLVHSPFNAARHELLLFCDQGPNPVFPLYFTTFERLDYLSAMTLSSFEEWSTRKYMLDSLGEGQWALGNMKTI